MPSICEGTGIKLCGCGGRGVGEAMHFSEIRLIIIYPQPGEQTCEIRLPPEQNYPANDEVGKIGI
jgi:hypothetical protein